MLATCLRLSCRIAVTLLVAGLLVGCFKPSDCTEGDFRELSATLAALRHGDLPTLFGEDGEGSARDLYPDWMKNAKLCQVGQYSVIAPAEGETNDLWLFVRDGGPTVIVVPEAVHVIEQPRTWVASLYREEPNGPFQSIEHDAYDDPNEIVVSVHDSDFDGHPDMRVTAYRGDDSRSPKWEQSVGNCWWERVWEGEELGLLIDGEFYPLEEA